MFKAKSKHKQPNGAIGSYGIQPLDSIYDNLTCIYEQKHVYMAAYSHIYPYIQPKCTQIVNAIAS